MDVCFILFKLCCKKNNYVNLAADLFKKNATEKNYNKTIHQFYKKIINRTVIY